MTHDIAIFLDLDNLVIGAKQAHFSFDINLVMAHIKAITNGRIVLRRAYGDGLQERDLLRELAAAGFVTQSSLRISHLSKNLADMQILVDTMETLIDGQTYDTYVIMSGDRDFTPLVQALRKRGKKVIGVGIRHTTSASLANLCDQFIFYEELLPMAKIDGEQVEDLLATTLKELLRDEERVRASILKQSMIERSQGAFDSTTYIESSFRRFLERFPHLATIEQEGTTTYVRFPEQQVDPASLAASYRTALKKRRLRVVAPEQRLTILRDLIDLLQQEADVRWRPLVNTLAERYARSGKPISKNVINDVLLLTRRAQVIHILKDRSLSVAPVRLNLQREKAFQQAVLRCDGTYLQEILTLPEAFNVQEAALALYEKTSYAPYIQWLLNSPYLLNR